MNNCEKGVTEGRQSYHRTLDTIENVKGTVHQSAKGLGVARAQIEKMRKHINAIDDDLVKDDKRMQVLKNAMQMLYQKLKMDSEDLTKLYRRVGECEDAYLRLSGEEDPEHRPSSPLAPIEESSSEDDHDTTMATQGNSDRDSASPEQAPIEETSSEDADITMATQGSSDHDIASPDQTPMDGVEAEHTGVTKDVAASTLDKEVVSDEDMGDMDSGSARPPSAGEDTDITNDLTASASNKEAVDDEDTRATDPEPVSPPNAVKDFTRDLASGYKRSGEESGINGARGDNSGSVPAVEPQHILSREVDAGKASAEGDDDDEGGVE